MNADLIFFIIYFIFEGLGKNIGTVTIKNVALYSVTCQVVLIKTGD